MIVIWIHNSVVYSFTFPWVDANEFSFFCDQVTFYSTQRYQVNGTFLGTLEIDSEADVSSLRHKFPSEYDDVIKKKLYESCTVDVPE
jgi:hypothetical protein